MSKVAFITGKVKELTANHRNIEGVVESIIKELVKRTNIKLEELDKEIYNLIESRC